MPDQVGQSEFENSDEDQIMQDDLGYSSVWDRSRSPRERNTKRDKESKIILKMKQSLDELQDL